MQTIQIGLSVLSNIILGGITGAIINVISCVRNILCYKDKLDMKAKIIITILSVVLSIAFNNLAFIGLLPLLATTLYVWFMNEQNIIKFKILMIVTSVMWFIYDMVILSYTSAIFDFLTALATVFAIIQILIKNKKICRFLKSYDIIIPVPIHYNRKLERRNRNSKKMCRRNL